VNKVALREVILRKLWLIPPAITPEFKKPKNLGFYWSGISRHVDSLCFKKSQLGNVHRA